MINELRNVMEKSIEVNGLNHPHTLKIKEMLDIHINSQQRDYSKESITNADIKRGLLYQSLFRKLISEALNPSRQQEVFEAAMRANESVEDEEVSRISVCLDGKTYKSDTFLSAFKSEDKIFVIGSCFKNDLEPLSTSILNKILITVGYEKFLSYINTMLGKEGFVAEIKVKEGGSVE